MNFVTIWFVPKGISANNVLMRKALHPGFVWADPTPVAAVQPEPALIEDRVRWSGQYP